MPRCPNGTRKNPKTKMCEKKLKNILSNKKSTSRKMELNHAPKSDFISNFEKKNVDDQNAIEKEILNYFINKKNKNLFDEIKNFIILTLNESINMIDEFESIAEIIKKYEKNNITQFLLSELQDFEVYFRVKKISDIYKIVFEIRFQNVKYKYNDTGNSSDFGYNSSDNYTFNKNINSDMKKVLKLLFDKDLITEKCWTWFNKYKEIL
jgi:uncharacterized membrane protein YheB (UPF0754 family)